MTVQQTKGLTSAPAHCRMSAKNKKRLSKKENLYLFAEIDPHPPFWLSVTLYDRLPFFPFPRAQELCESRGGRPGLPFLTLLTVSVDVKQHWTLRSELKSCVKVKAAVLGSPSLIGLMVSMDVKQHCTLLPPPHAQPVPQTVSFGWESVHYKLHHLKEEGRREGGEGT